MNPPDPTDPWAKHYATRGLPRPPMIEASAQGDVVVPPEKDGWEFPLQPKGMPSVRPASIPRTSSRKGALQTNPQFEFVNEAAMGRAAKEAVVKRRREAMQVWHFIGFAVLLVLGIGIVNEVASYLIDDLPPTDLLAARSSEIGQQVRRLYNLPAQPLGFPTAKTILFDRESARWAAYEVVVTVRLSADLYAQADSNGAQPYLQMQQSLADARIKVLKHGLFLEVPALRETPELPQLLVLTHRAGEKLIVKVPLAAARSRWRWQTGVVDFERRRVNRRLTGEVLANFSAGSYIIFGTPDAREVMRQKMAAARRYIIAVNSEMNRRGLAE